MILVMKSFTFESAEFSVSAMLTASSASRRTYSRIFRLFSSNHALADYPEVSADTFEGEECVSSVDYILSE